MHNGKDYSINHTCEQQVAYLGTRPFQEVFQLIQEVQKEAQAQQTEISNPSLQ